MACTAQVIIRIYLIYWGIRWPKATFLHESQVRRYSNHQVKFVAYL